MMLKPSTPFKISSLDPMGQGVSKLGERITFIPKVLPEEEGEAIIHSQKKGVAFGTISKLTRSSPERIEPVCPHFSQCPSCHYLHVPYEKELEFKKQSLERLFRKLPLPEIKVIAGIRRLQYRNRIQLHYDTKKQVLGMLNTQLQAIVEVPGCQMGLPAVAAEIQRLYQNGQWLKEAPKNSPRGHVEIYWREEKLQTTWNRPYAEGGFSQVFAEMNEALKNELRVWQGSFEGPGNKPTDLLDLFAGNGNLSSVLNYSQRLCVDRYESPPGPEFFSQHLYAQNALKNVQQRLKQQNMLPKTVLIDPPRSGLKDLDSWLAALKPDHVAYVSCDPHTLARDLQSLEGFRIKEILLLDFFPSTYHFETAIFLERKT